MDTIGGGEVSLGDLADLTVTNDNDLSCDVSRQGAPPSTAPIGCPVQRQHLPSADCVVHAQSLTREDKRCRCRQGVALDRGTKVQALEGSGARVFIMVPGSFCRRCSLPPRLMHSPSPRATTAGGEARGN